jgi:hypothetical protein
LWEARWQPPKLAELSAQLARHLYVIAERDERVSDATLAVLLCRGKQEGPGTRRLLTLLKLDPSDGFHPVGDTDPKTGKSRVRFALDHNVFPTRGERLQKCAFLTAVDPQAEYELLVVDRQRRGEVVSKFWMSDFLGAELVLDAAERTTRLYRELRNARNEVAPQLDAQQLAALEQHIDGAVVGASINLDTLRRLAARARADSRADRCSAVQSAARPRIRPRPARGQRVPSPAQLQGRQRNPSQRSPRLRSPYPRRGYRPNGQVREPAAPGQLRDPNVDRGLTFSVAPLVELCLQLGIRRDQLATVERVNELAHTFPVTAINASRLDVDHLRAFVAEYGDAASLELRTGELVELAARGEVDEVALGAFIRRASTGGPFDAIVRVDKTRLVARLAGNDSARTVHVFFFAKSLSNLLRRGINSFEHDVWSNASSPLVLVVLDTDIGLAGPHLTVLGGAFSERTPEAARVPPAAGDLAAISSIRDRHIGWDASWTIGLTPWHFQLAGTCADSELLGFLQAQFVKLAILFTCDRARTRRNGTPAVILAEFRGREHVAVVPIHETRPLQLSADEAAAILRSVDFCYERRGQDGEPNWVADRLPFVQIRVAQTLEPHPVESRLDAYAATMPYLIEGIEWHRKAWVEGKISEYLDRVQQLESLVSDTVSRYADRAGGLVKNLRETMLAALAVLVGSFIAAALKSPFNAVLFRIAVLS